MNFIFYIACCFFISTDTFASNIGERSFETKLSLKIKLAKKVNGAEVRVVTEEQLSNYSFDEAINICSKLFSGENIEAVVDILKYKFSQSRTPAEKTNLLKQITVHFLATCFEQGTIAGKSLHFLDFLKEHQEKEEFEKTIRAAIAVFQMHKTEKPTDFKFNYKNNPNDKIFIEKILFIINKSLTQEEKNDLENNSAKHNKITNKNIDFANSFETFLREYKEWENLKNTAKSRKLEKKKKTRKKKQLEKKMGLETEKFLLDEKIDATNKDEWGWLKAALNLEEIVLPVTKKSKKINTLIKTIKEEIEKEINSVGEGFNLIKHVGLLMKVVSTILAEYEQKENLTTEEINLIGWKIKDSNVLDKIVREQV